MKLSTCIKYIILFLSFKTIDAQEEVLSCNYTISNSLYSCLFTIQNPNGLNNFEIINGTHAENSTDDDVLKIIVQSGSITTNVPSIICEQFPNLQIIDLGHVGIERIDQDSFSGCRRLTSLDLYNNRIAEIVEDSFIENVELQTLYLWYNHLTTLPEKIFERQQKLTSLWFDSNRIQDLPADIFHSLVNLTRLNLNNNQISNLRVEWFENLENLQRLYLFLNQIEVLPRNVFSNLRSLTLLSLWNNNLTAIHSSAFSILPNLRELYVFNNQIDAVDEYLIDNTGLIRFDIRNNTCANINIFDNSTTREFMRGSLNVCFINHIGTTTTTSTLPPGCIGGNSEFRICSLENDNNIFHQDIGQLRDENQNLRFITEDLQRQIDELRDDKKELQKIVGNLMNENEELLQRMEMEMKAIKEENKIFGETLKELREKFLN